MTAEMSPYELRAISKVSYVGDGFIRKAIYCQSLNHFLFIDNRGQFFLGDGNGEVIFGPIIPIYGRDDDKFLIDYSYFHNCLLAWDGKKFNIRRDLGGSWLLKTILIDKPETTDNVVVNMELTLNDGTKLLQYLRAPAVKLICPDNSILSVVLEDLQKGVDDAKEEEKNARGHKWATVLLRGQYDFLLSTLTAALADLKQTGLRLPVLPIISAVIERLSSLKENNSFEFGSDVSGFEKSIMASEAARRLTFSRWPHLDYKWALPEQMAEAGFYHHPNTAGDDRVFCFTCTICLVCWEPADEPWSEHERHAPTCPYVKGEYTQNVPMSVVYASSSALPYNCGDEVTCVSTSSFCSWVASSTRHGEIVLWNIAKELKKCDPITLDPSEPFVEMKTGYRSRPRRTLKSGVAWADETEILSPAISISPNTSGSESLREAVEPGHSATASGTEIAVVNYQKGDFIVTSMSTCGQPVSKRSVSEILDADGQCTAALVVGCGIVESKLRSDQRTLEIPVPSSFVENLNTVNKASSSFNECILPPSKTPADGAASSTTPDDQPAATCSSAPKYRPFILVYKIEEAILDLNRRVCYTEKSRRTGEAPSATGVDKTILTSVKEEVNEPLPSPPIPLAYEDTDEDVDLDEKDVLTDAISSGAGSFPSSDIQTVWPAYSTPATTSTGFGQGTFSHVHTMQEASVALNSFTSPNSGANSVAPSTSVATSVVLAESPNTKKSALDEPASQVFIKDDTHPLKASLAVLQCLRLPSQLDSALYYVHSIVPCTDGCAVLVVVNRNENIVFASKEPAGLPVSAILLYRLSFSCHMASLMELPHRQIYFDADVGALDSVVHLQSSGAGDDGSDANLVALLTTSGDLRIVSVDTGATVAKHSPPLGKKFTAFCAYHDEKLCAACDDGTICTLELLRPDVLIDEMENADQNLAEDSVEWKDSDLLVNKPLTVDILRDLWNLTRSDWETSGQFSMQAPSSWVEVQQHQRLRKNPQHYLREEKLAKSWHLVPDIDTWFEHIFEITLPANFLASHIDFRFVLHRAGVVGLPPIQVTFLRQLPTAGSRFASAVRSSGAPLSAVASASTSDAPGTSAVLVEPDEQFVLKNHVFNKNFLDNLHAEIVAGPFDLHSALDLYDLNGLLQFSSTQLSNSKSRTFFIHIQALSKSGVENPKVKPVDPKKGLQRVASAGSASAMENMSTGLYQQKYGVNKYGMPSGKSGAAANVRVVQSRNAADARKLEDLKGCDWIQEVSVIVWRSKKTILKKERKQRAAMIRNTDFITSLIKALDRGLTDGKPAIEVDSLACQQYLILDLLVWIIQQGTAETRRVLQPLVIALEGRLDQLFHSCYVNANRTVSRKFTALLADTLRKIKSGSTESYSSFLSRLKDVIRRFVFNVDTYRNSGSVVWLIALAEEVHKQSPTGCSSFVADMQQFVCSIGEILKQESELHCKTFPARYGLLGFPFELDLFELPPPVLMLSQKSQQPFTYAAVTSTGSTTTANFCSDFAHEENDWLEIAGVEYSPPIGVSPRSQRRGRVIRLEREHLYGLMEVEPLRFVCHGASDGIKIENLETGVSMAVTGANSAPTSTGAGPIPLPDMTQYEQSGNPALTNAVTSMKQQVQSILSKQMQLLAIQQQKQKLQVKLTDHVEKLANLAAEQIPLTQASSASTFGVPTTPKTTPFMTPTPLSPSHLSPINSEVDLHFDDGGVETDEQLYNANVNQRRPKLVPSEYLKPPPVQALVVERMSSGARKYVVLNFDSPILLTDLVIPQCGDIGSLSIDVWMKSESDDGQRLVVCNDIAQKTLILCDLQPPCLCQYLKITYIGRQGLGSCTSKIPLGSFYGFTYATPSQLCVVDGVNTSGAGRTFDEVSALRHPYLSIDQLRQLEEDVACRYNLACELLRNLIESPDSSTEGMPREKETESAMVRELCREISSIRIQWNLINRAIERMSVSTGSNQAKLDKIGFTTRLSYDKARVISELLLSALLRLSPLMKLDTESENVLAVNTDSRSILSLNTAVEIFERFCVSGVPCLTALSTIWILHHGAYTSWWGALFGCVLDKYFSDEGDAGRTQKIFLILSFLVDRGLASGNNAIFMDLLQRLNGQLLEDSSSKTDVQRSFQLTLVLLSHSFDNFPHGRMVGSRWDFLLGEYSKRRYSSPKTDGDSNNNPNRNAKIMGGNYGFYKDPVYQSEELIAQHHQKVMQLSSELKEYVKTKSFKPTFSKHTSKSSSALPYGYDSQSGYATFPADSKPSEPRTRHPAAVDPRSTSATGRSTSSSQKKSRLKLPYELCRTVAIKLASLILRSEASISAEVFIMTCKVLSVICRCSRPLLHLSDVYVERDQIGQLIRTIAISRNVYVRRALICLVQDFVASEAKCDNARSAAAKGPATSLSQNAMPVGGGESSGTSVESELEARAGIAPTTAANSTAEETNSADQIELNEAIENMADLLTKHIEDKQAAAAAAGTSSGPKVDFGLQWGLSKIVETPGGAEEFIESWVDTIKTLPVVDLKISEEKRQQRLRDMFREVLYFHSTKFGPSWLQDTKTCSDLMVAVEHAEQTAAKASVTDEQYYAQVEKFLATMFETENVLEAMDSKPFMDDGFSDEALLAATKAVIGAVGSSNLPPGEWEVVATTALGPMSSNFGSLGPTPIMPPIDQSMSGYYTSMVAPVPPVTSSGQNLAEAKDALWKLCEQLNASAAKVSSVYMPLSDLPPPPPPPPGAASTTNTIVLDFGPMVSSAVTTGDAHLLWDEDSDSEGTPLESEMATPMVSSFVANVNPTSGSAPAHLWKVQDASTSGQKKPEVLPLDASSSGLENIQPISLALDERMESQLGWQAEVCIRRWLLANNASLRMALQTATLYQKPTTGSSFVQQREQRISHTHISSAVAIAGAFTELFDMLSPSTNPTFVENLLDGCWLLSIGSDAKTHEMPLAATTRAINLGERALEKLLAWLLDGIGVSEKIWCLALRILAVLVRLKTVDITRLSNKSCGITFVDDPNFAKVIRRLLTKVRLHGPAELAGPAISQSLFDLFTCIHLHLSGMGRQYIDRFREILVRIVSDLLNERDLRAISQIPLDTLNKTVEFLLNQPGVWRFEPRLVADMVHSLMVNVREYLSGCETSVEALFPNGSANPRYCFLVGKPDLTTNEFRCFHDRLDVVMVSLLKLADKLLNCSEISSPFDITALGRGGESLTDDAKAGASALGNCVAETVLDLKPTLVENLLNAIEFCHCGSNIKDLQLTDICNTLPVTAADGIVQLLFTLMNRATGVRLSSFLMSATNYLEVAGDDGCQPLISDLSVYALMRIFDTCAIRNEFLLGKSGVVAILARQLVQSCQAIDPTPSVEYSHLLRSAAAVCGRGPKSSESGSKRLSEMKVDGMTNFAPLCSIASSSPMAHHLSALLNSTPPHRRARSAAWSYHFYPAESWLDMTLTLPYAVMLKEIQIRPHLGSLQTSPTAVQVELSPDSNASSFRSIAPPSVTSGCTKIRISTESFASPVRMVRLHFKRPPDAPSLGMSQILLLGHSSLSTEQASEDCRLWWLQLFHHTLKQASSSFFQPVYGQLCSSLSRRLVEMFLNAPLNCMAFSQLIDVFAMLEADWNKAGSESPLKWFLGCIGAKECAYRSSSLVWIAELFRHLCSSDSCILDNRNTIKIYASRIGMLMQWVYEAVEAYCAGRRISLPILRCVTWTCACVIWHWPWQSESSQQKLSIRPDLIKVLHKCARDSDACGLSPACGYLLCSIVRMHPENLDKVLHLCRLGNFASTAKSNVKDARCAASISPSNSLNVADLRVLTLVSQSGSALRTLVANGVLPYLVNILTSMCIEGGVKNHDLIVSIVELLKDLANEPFMKNWVTGPDGSIFWVPLLTHVCLSQARSLSPNDAWQRLETATISLLRRCISCNRRSQELVSNLLARLLTELSGGLNGSIQRLILRVLLEDEKLTVVTEDEKLIRSGLIIHHPQYGCGIHVLVREVSVYANCASLLPDTTSRKSTKPAKRVSYSANSDLSDVVSYYGGDSALVDVTFAGEKAKAKRLAKPGLGDSKGESGGKSGTPAACPVAYLSNDLFGKTCPLPAKLMIGQLYWKLLSVDDDAGSVRLSIRYGLPSAIENAANAHLVQSVSVPQSTLEVFARQGGLALLAEHLQLYQPTVNVQSVRTGGVVYSDHDMKILEEMQASAGKPFMGDPEMMDYYDPSYEWVNVASGGADGYVADSKIHFSNRMRNVVSVGLSPHVVVCFGTFLRVSGYAERLVTQDRRQAQWLLRLAMGVTTDALGVNIINSAEAGSMGILPFEILSSLYSANQWNTEEGRLVRAVSLDLGIPQLLLRCLAVFSHQNERRSSPVEEKPEVVKVVDQLLTALAYSEQQPGGSQPLGDEKSHLYWAKGTGFGTGSTQQQWNMDLHIVKQKQDEQSVACLQKVLAQFIYAGDRLDPPVSDSSVPSTSAAADGSVLGARWTHFVRLISDSCLVPTLQSYLRNDSVLDISRHVAVYESVMRLLCSLALSPQLCDLLTELGDQQQSLRSLLLKLKECVDIYISKLEPLRKAGVTADTEEAATEEGLLKLVPLIERTSELVQMHKSDADVEDGCGHGRHRSASGISNGLLSNEERYMRALKPLQFDSFKFLKETNGEIRFAIPYHYEASVQGAGKDICALAPCVRRLAQEAVTLSTSLPLSYSSSVFVRTADERLDVMKVLIMGPSDTPYANGCFEFDVWFPTDYPNSPMHINLQTTGGSTVRFNPNLYNDGKVCLSILNTWHGRPEERWNAQTSSFLQVLVSIQSLILVTDPYFNEPGYERSRGTPAGQHASREYDANIRQATVKWGMLEMLRSPPACFKEVVNRHFWIKREEITKQIETWIAELESASGGGADKRVQRNLVTHVASLKRHFNALKEEFAKMVRPGGLEEESGERLGEDTAGV